MPPPIPVTLIGGYLGAGKTTLVNQLLRHAGGRRLAVLVNDFGDLPIDAALIESRDGNLLQLAGGCVCCSFGSDLMAALQRMCTLRPQPQQILIETSGVARPDGVARTLGLLPGLRLDAVLVLADAETVRERAADRYVGELVQQQLAAADLLLLNKCDLVTPPQLDALHRWLPEVAAAARIVDCTHAGVDAALCLGDLDVPFAATGRAKSPRADAPALALRNMRAASPFESLSLEFDHAVRTPCLAEALAAPSLQLLRAKGLVRDADGSVRVVQVVGQRASCDAAPPGPMTRGRLVCIALRGQLQADRIRAALVACTA
jgi:G3E family GTPase